mmetsp:Transcript_122913/g.274446  ORF Transcript_122913/g.274446 Transcript_122913/m.274446 type:complete len:253 (-) Transcript_122913:1087-1845(-)
MRRKHESLLLLCLLGFLSLLTLLMLGFLPSPWVVLQLWQTAQARCHSTHGEAHVGGHGPRYHPHLMGRAYHATHVPKRHPRVPVHVHSRHARRRRPSQTRGRSCAACTDCVGNSVRLIAAGGLRRLSLLVLLLLILFLLLLFLLVRIAVDYLFRPFLVNGVGEISLDEGGDELLVMALLVECPDTAGGAVLLKGAVPILVFLYSLVDELPHQLLVLEVHGAPHNLLGNVHGLCGRLHPLCHEGLLVTLEGGD